MQIVSLLQVIVAILVMLILVLISIYVYLVYSDKHKRAKNENGQIGGSGEYGSQDKSRRGYESGKFQGVLSKESIFEFLDFDEILDNMIIRKDRTQYVMVIQCNGVNYDLMSEQEKLSVEEGFVQFLNTLRFPIQLYVQTRSLNLRDIIEEYKARVSTLSSDIEKLNAKIAQATASGNRAVKEKLEFEKRRKENVLEYGMDITEYVSRMSSNRNVLQQKTFVVVSYYTAEFGGGLDTYSKEEIDSMCFSELYTRCQSIISSISTCGVRGKILRSNELIELLYMAYNRDEAETFGLDKALKAGFNELYSTAPDIYEKRMKELDKEIEEKAMKKARAKVNEAKSDLQKQVEEKQNNMNNIIDEIAKMIIEENEPYIGKKVKDKAIEKLEKNTKEGGNENGESQKTRGRKKSTTI